MFSFSQLLVLLALALLNSKKIGLEKGFPLGIFFSGSIMITFILWPGPASLPERRAVDPSVGGTDPSGDGRIPR